jgi:hypothetical protein
MPTFSLLFASRLILMMVEVKKAAIAPGPAPASASNNDEDRRVAALRATEGAMIDAFAQCFSARYCGAGASRPLRPSWRCGLRRNDDDERHWGS